MADLIIRPSGMKDRKIEYILQLRYADSCGPTEYYDIRYVSEELGRAIIEAGQAYWLFGKPGDK